jgi:dihydroorotase (homodimeric type)
MPNLVPPVRTVQDAAAYRAQILAAVPEGVAFEPQMTLYLTDNTSAADIEAAAASGFVRGCKLYPAGATTNSDFGVTDVSKITGALEAMAACGLVLEVHGEVTHASVDAFDRERVFLDETLRGLCEGPRAVKGLKIVMEHITTSEAVAFCESQGENVAATITPQHILYNRNAMLVGGIRPHLYCLPILKREKHREAVTRAAPKRARAGARASFPRTRRCPSTPPRSKKKASWKNWRGSRRSTAPTFTASRATPGRRRCEKRRGPCRRRTSSAATSWCRSSRAKPWTGKWWAHECS